MKYSRAIASFVLNRSSKTLYVFWDTGQKEVSDPGSHTVLFSLPLFQICFFIQVYLWRGSVLSCKKQVFHAVVSFWTKFFPCMIEPLQFLPHIEKGIE